MGTMKINGKDLVAPADERSVEEIKELAGVPRNERLYRKDGQVLEDRDVVDTEGADLGVTTAWERG